MTRIVLILSLVVAGLLVIISGSGLAIPSEIYSNELPGWYAQCVGQDIVDLFVVLPVFIISSLLTYRRNKKALLVWAGSLVYLLYTFVIYCFDVHFNRLFILYCAVLGLTVYLLAWAFIFISRYLTKVQFDERAPIKLTAIYLIVVGFAFYALWLSVIIPANIQGSAPKEVIEAGLFTNPVHVLDIAIVLPAIVGVGIYLWRGQALAQLIAPVILTLFVLMDLTIGGLMIVMGWQGGEISYPIMAAMFALALISIALLILFFYKMHFRE